MNQKNKFLLLMIICMALLQTGGSIVCADDFVNKEAAIEQEKEELASRYIALTGKHPDIDNLLGSLKSVNARGEKASEVVAALDLLRLSASRNKNIAQDIKTCYRQNSYWLIQIKCVEALEAIDEVEGDKLAKEVLNNKQIDIEGKLILGLHFVKKGKLIFYPVLREGLTTKNKYQQKLARELFDEFRRHEGKPYDESGNKVDLKKLSEETGN